MTKAIVVRRDARWWTLAGGLLAAALGAAAISHEGLRPGHGLGLGFGLAAAGLVVWGALLGLRKRWLRLRVGSVASWSAAHNALGALALGLALLHGRFEADGLVPGGLIWLLVATVGVGLIGMLLQAVLPRLLAARLLGLPPAPEPAVAIVRAWRRCHDLVTGVCGPAESIEGILTAAEAELGVAAPAGATPAGAAGAGTAPDTNALALFYAEVAFPFLGRPEAGPSPLNTEVSARLAFDALRANVGAAHAGAVEEMHELCREVRLRREERRLRRILFGWKVLHVPLGMATLALLGAHVLAVLYY